MYNIRNTPVLFIIFNRPDTTARVFEAIAKAKPRRLFIAADGPRPDKAGEAEKCKIVREIVQRVDWECEVKTLFREENFGCKMAVSSAITWFFEQVEEGIILEDDCLPSDSFFPFCTELLERYRNDSRVMMISGNNFQDGIQRGDASYYFSAIPWIWGWATWRRAWWKYDVSMRTLPSMVRDRMVQSLSLDEAVQQYRLRYFIPTYEGEIDTWDYQWIYSILINHGLSVCPQVNLVRNIGFSAEATHTFDSASKMAEIPAGTLQAIRHPSLVLPDVPADDYFYDQYLNVYCNSVKNPFLRWRRMTRRRRKVEMLVRHFLERHDEMRRVRDV